VKKCLRNYLLLIMGMLFLSGCAGGVSDTAVLKLLDASGNVVATLTGAAVQRDWLYTMQHQNRDKQTAKMYKASGVTMEMEKVTLSDGSFAYLPKKFSVRGEPSSQQDLAIRPPDHRGWQTADKILDFATFGLGAYFLNDFGKHSISASQSRHTGDYNFQSFNPATAEPYFAPTAE